MSSFLAKALLACLLECGCVVDSVGVFEVIQSAHALMTFCCTLDDDDDDAEVAGRIREAVRTHRNEPR
jgi:hypothetical protein